MAATTAVSTLSTPEDVMEVSSPVNQFHDDDIDLDFGDGEYDGGVELEGEPMLTDGEQARPQTATDDMMDDDVHDTTLHVPEAEMHDTPDIQPPANDSYDEELIDYGNDEDLELQHTADSTHDHADEGLRILHEQPDIDVEEADEQTIQPHEGGPVEQQAVLDDFASYEFVAGDATANIGTDQAALKTEPLVEEAQDLQIEEYEDSGAHTAEEENDQSFEVAPAGEQLDGQPGITVDTTSYPSLDAPPTPTDTGLHPVTLYYLEHAMPLFRSKHQPDGLLKNDNLAHVHLHDLMSNCRERLALRIGNLPEVQDFTLAFDHLGLMVAGTSTAAFLTSLNDVLDVYLHLHRNDGLQDIPPLSVILTHDRFASQLSMLKQAAESGTGMTHFVPKSEEEAYEDEEEDEADLDDDGTGHGEQRTSQQEQHVGGSDEEEGTEALAEELVATGDANLGYPAGDQYYQGDEYEDEDGHVEEQTYGEEEEQVEGQTEQQASHVEHERNAASLAEDAQRPDLSLARNTSATAEAGTFDEHAAVVGDPSLSGEGLRGNAPKAASIASSETVKGDGANDFAGKYDEEDLIDWDDDSDLTHVPSEQVVDGQDDFATYLTENEAEEAQAVLSVLDGQSAADLVAGHERDALATNGEHSVTEQYAAGDDELYLGSEVLPDPGTYEDDAVDARDDDTGGVEHDGQYEEHYDEADNYEEQHEAAYEEPGEDEQFDATHDLIDEGDYEHGLEHQPNGEEHAGWDETAAATENGHQNQLDTAAEDPFDLEDDIGFDDETTEQHEARKASHSNTLTNGTDSPLGKRPFEEHTDDEFGLDEEPEVKKPRSK
ncbi:hypothetical protein LTR91_007076 [Friedmanniomyces endolithicus]|uniref:Uncharacterized protein n=1 Tax=Friedmanniomyces endolithicus TaxID=329885 RepID=A0AAN6J8N0_9PEZI|nr:hypothetical protein LTS00_013046 [Friedmanniomyces endolithicus]KAK0280415.1 hypothetical protein LTR35_008057 [Friedmanniomyces endolithicus]KAK0320480.1 hypothetical protein LTR82_008595 [Friedmanniomyces endolithicus]KAK0929856.1 hypothetical protein LTR57_001713 [Friedmanniomyces endolithicus]KAK0996103.1 hypothetical protein LTR91_007076 [Friedmanniomyces endolithicus]